MPDNKKQQKQTFLQGAAILAVATAIVKLIGAIYKIPLQSVIGKAGYGYFGTAYSIYDVLLMVSTTGLPVAMSRMISEAQTLERHDQIRKIFRVALRVFLVLGIVGTAGMLFGAKLLSGWIQQNDRAWFAIACLAPAVLLVSIIAAFRGFFQGQSNMTPTSVSQVFEALCKLVFGLGFAMLLMDFTMGNETFGAGGAILGVTIGCAVSAIYLAMRYRKASKALPKGGDTDSSKKILKTLLAIAVPITIGSAGLQIINLVDSAVYMGRLVGAAGVVSDRADELKGIYEFCRTIFNLPGAFITPLVISIIPAITSHLTMKNERGVRMVEGSALRITGLIAMPCAFGLACLSVPVLALLAPEYTAADMQVGSWILALFGITVIFNSLILVTNAMMQAHGDVITPVINMILGGVVKVVINFVLVGIPELNIIGAAIGTLVCYLVIIVLNVAAMAKKKTIALSSLVGLIKPLIASALMGAVAYMVHGFISAYLSASISTLVAIAAAGVCYLILVIVLRVITYDDCQLLPKGEKIAKILRIRKN